MKTLTGPVVAFDCDNTLVLWNVPPDYPGPVVKITSYNGFAGMWITKTLAINTPMVEKLKEIGRSDLNGIIMVWSFAGAEWATGVVQALGLDQYVDIVMGKPVALYDDWPIDLWLPEPQHLLPPGWRLDSGVVKYDPDYVEPEGDQNG